MQLYSRDNNSDFLVNKKEHLAAKEPQTVVDNIPITKADDFKWSSLSYNHTMCVGQRLKFINL